MRRILAVSLLSFACLRPAVADGPKGKVQEFRLDNGLTVLLRPIEGAKDAALVVLFMIGGDNDGPAPCGTAHLVEHCYVTAAAGDAKARTAESWMASHPKGSNAQTGDDYTVIATVFPKESLDAEIAEAAARMGELKIEQADLDREKPRVLAELANMYGGIPALAAMNLARGAWEKWRQNVVCPRREGEDAAITAITLDEVRTRWTRFYKAKNAILALAGGFDPIAARARIAQALDKVRAGDDSPGKGGRVVDPILPAPPPPPRLERVTVKARAPGEPARVSLAVPLWRPGGTYHPGGSYRPEAATYEAQVLVFVARMWERTAEISSGPPAFPSPVYYAPLDAPDAICLSAPVPAGETPEKTLAALDAFLMRVRPAAD